MKRQPNVSSARRSSTSPMGAAPYISNSMLDRSASAMPGTASSACTTVGTRKVCVTRWRAANRTASAGSTAAISTVWPPTIMVEEP